MSSILDIRVQKLFFITLVIKIGSSFLGWYFQYQWTLGLAVPIAIMITYIVLGYYRHDTDVSDEKFADSCYYLGFIFTITSIIFSLFDLPNIGTKIQDIAVRFGAAMVSTVLGLSVRVYLVSFKKDIADAIVDAETAVMDAAAKFTEQLKVALDRLRDFESQVDVAARTSVERVNMQVENLSRNHAAALTEFFTDLTNRNQEAFTKALGDVKGASLRLSSLVDRYSLGVNSNLSGIETKVIAFSEAVTERLKTTTFPDDYFATRLEAPLAQLNQAAVDVSGTLRQASAEISESSVVLSLGLKKLRQKAHSADGTLDALAQLTKEHQAVLASTQGQLDVVERLATTLSTFDGLLSGTLAGINASNNVTSELASRVSSIVDEGRQARKSLESSVADVIGRLQANSLATDAVANKLGESAAVGEGLVIQLAANASASELIAVKLDSVAAADVDSAQTIDLLGRQASTVMEKVESAVVELQGMVRQLTALDSALRAQSSELKHAAERIADVKVVVEVPSQGIGPTVINGHEATATASLLRLTEGPTALVGASGLEQSVPHHHIGVRAPRESEVGPSISQQSSGFISNTSTMDSHAGGISRVLPAQDPVIAALLEPVTEKMQIDGPGPVGDSATSPSAASKTQMPNV